MAKTTRGGRRRFLKSAGLAGIAAPSASLIAGLAPAAAQETASLRPMTVPYDVRAFGTTGDGKTIDSGAINRAIEYVERMGGGTIYFRAGNYLCYSIHLKSKVTLYLDQGATIVAAAPASHSAQTYDP